MTKRGFGRGAAALLLAAAALVAGAALAPASTTGGYAGRGSTTPRRLRAGRPGDVISTTPIIAPAGSRAWRVLYHSRAVDGRDVAVSGVIVAPTGKGQPGGRPVLAWAHGT